MKLIEVESRFYQAEAEIRSVVLVVDWRVIEMIGEEKEEVRLRTNIKM